MIFVLGFIGALMDGDKPTSRQNPPPNVRPLPVFVTPAQVPELAAISLYSAYEAIESRDFHSPQTASVSSIYRKMIEGMLQRAADRYGMDWRPKQRNLIVFTREKKCDE